MTLPLVTGHLYDAGHGLICAALGDGLRGCASPIYHVCDTGGGVACRRGPDRSYMHHCQGSTQLMKTRGPHARVGLSFTGFQLYFRPILDGEELGIVDGQEPMI